ncbi:NUDIX domain-containing protein [Streptosporangium sandarakinum]
MDESVAASIDPYVASLPRKWMGASALLRNAAGEVLLVDPVYKPGFEVPGGSIDQGESPRAACRREVFEEIGLDRPVGRLLVVDWVPPRPGWPYDGMIFFYDGGILGEEEIAAIRLQEEELAEWVFASPDQVAALVPAVLARRIAACLRVLDSGATVSMEEGYLV